MCYTVLPIDDPALVTEWNYSYASVSPVYEIKAPINSKARPARQK